MLKQIVHAIQNDEVVCFPTETLYALACNPFSESAMRKLYDLKKRQYFKPCPLLFSSLEKICELSDVDDQDLQTMRTLLGGHITFVLPLRTTHALPNMFFKDTLAARVSEHKIANGILHALEYPLVATSANISGISGATKASDIPNAIRSGVSVIIEDDSLVDGKCSTVFDVKSRRILRKGSVSDETIFDIISATAQ